jgi:CO/xanthine dehydrogenase Mo-binding subunit
MHQVNMGLGIADTPIFADKVIRYHGEPIAAIAAKTLEQAQAAAREVEIELIEQNPILKMKDSLADGAKLVHPNWAEYDVLFEGAERKGNIALGSNCRKR